LCFIIGALLAPPDVASLCLVAIPMYLMVEISIHLIRQIEKKRSGSVLQNLHESDHN
jgi:sec-independent protein translocase protein TatC